MNNLTGFGFMAATLRDSGHAITEHLDITTVEFQHIGEHGAWQVFCRYRDPYPQIATFSVLPIAVPEQRRGAMTELMTRVNDGLFIGNYELDLDDGELRFRTSLDFSGDRLSGPLLTNLVTHNVSTFDRYLPAVNAVLIDQPAGADIRQLLEETERADVPG